MEDRGVIGHPRSDDLITRTVQPPLTTPGHGFGYPEVPQVQVVRAQPRTAGLSKLSRPPIIGGIHRDPRFHNFGRP